MRTFRFVFAILLGQLTSGWLVGSSGIAWSSEDGAADQFERNEALRNGDTQEHPGHGESPSAQVPSSHPLGSQALSSQPMQERIASLIQGLGAESYSTRVRCREQLERIGLSAFDQLRKARRHPDIEIAIEVRRLTSGLKIQWAQSTDTSKVRELLNEYGSFGYPARQQRIEDIGRLPREDSFDALLRLARFETEPVLARLAALQLMRSEPLAQVLQSNVALPASSTSQPAMKTVTTESEVSSIRTMLGHDSRMNARWLLQYADDLENQNVAFSKWDALIDQGRRELAGEDRGSSTVAVSHGSDLSIGQLNELIRTVAACGVRYGQRDQAIGLAVNHVDLIPSRTQDLMDAASWALDQRLYELVEAMYGEHRSLFDKSPVLLYAAVESYEKEGQAETAERLAQTALQINALPVADNADAKPKDETPLHPQIIEQRAEAHIDIAGELAERGLFHWAQREYQLVIDRLPVDATMSSYARLQLAAMLGELQRHAEVVDTLEPLTDRIDRDDEFKQRLISRRFSYPIVRSNMNYHKGLLLIEQGKLDEARPMLRTAFDLNRDNIDILIAMHQLTGDEQWRSDVGELLAQQIRLADSEVSDYRNAMQRIGPFRPSKSTLASRLNAYAWLVANTEGDYAKALRYSKESLRLTPDEPALMDTCARCHYAAGDLQSAVQVQAAACELMPHSPPLQRQLQQFRDELASRKQSSPSSSVETP